VEGKIRILVEEASTNTAAFSRQSWRAKFFNTIRQQQSQFRTTRWRESGQSASEGYVESIVDFDTVRFIDHLSDDTHFMEQSSPVPAAGFRLPRKSKSQAANGSCSNSVTAV
jgi:hypothetical protein